MNQQYTITEQYTREKFKLRQPKCQWNGSGRRRFAGLLREPLKLKHFLIPGNNLWLKRGCLIFAFVFFDYLSTLVFCRAPIEEANVFARGFMESYGIPVGLTLFVFAANLPLYVILSFDSHAVSLPPKLGSIVEPVVDLFFGWFVAGLHFSGGTSWFWAASDLTRQALGATLYLALALICAKTHGPRHRMQQ